MPHKDWGIGEEVLAVDFNPNVADQVVAQYASAAARASAWATPPAGAVSHLNTTDDKNGIEVYSAVSSAWRKPWNIPWGIVAFTRASTGVGNITTGVVDIPGCGATFIAIANRRYKSTIKFEVSSTVNGDVVLTQFTDGATNFDRLTGPVGTAAVTEQLVYFEGASISGSVTRKANITRVGSGILTVPSSPASSILIEDIGPIAGGAPT
jgi:hypothetical protein